MIFGLNNFLQMVVAASLLGLILGSPARAQSTETTSAQRSDALLNEVMSELAAVNSAKSKFVEKRYLKLLKEPVESSGTVTYTAPDRFEKHTTVPLQERMSVERHLVTLQVGNKRPQQIMIDHHPALAAITDAFRGALSGNTIMLREAFKVSAEGSRSKWLLNLVPMQQQQQQYIRAIKVSGAQNVINGIEVLQADGDRSVMTLTRSQ
jgi:hypothetical protein